MNKWIRKFTEIYLLFYLIVFTGFRYQIANPEILFYNGIILLVLAVVWLVYLLVNRKPPDYPNIVDALVLFGVVLLTSVKRSVDTSTSMVEIILLAIAGYLFFGIYQYCMASPDNRRSMVNSLMWVGLIFVSLKGSQMLALWDNRTCGSVYGALMIPNKTAGFLALVVVLALVESMGENRGMLSWTILATSATALFFTGSRGGYIGVFAGVAIILLASVIYTQRFNLKDLWIGAGVVLYPIVGTLVNRFPFCPGESGALELTGGYTKNLTTRWDLWELAFGIFKQFPMTGSGIGTFPVLAGPLYDYHRVTVHSHNLYLNTLAEMGLMGLLGSGLVIITLFKVFLVDVTRWEYKALGMGALSTFLFQGLVDVVTIEPYIFRYLVAILAVAISFSGEGKNDQQNCGNVH